MDTESISLNQEDTNTMIQNIRSVTPTYFLYKQCVDHYVVYAQGLSAINIHDLSKFQIVRMYPSPMKDLTPQIIEFQKRWKERRRYRRWCAHPHRLHYREIYGTYPPY
jgi:hypothetical protein